MATTKPLTTNFIPNDDEEISGGSGNTETTMDSPIAATYFEQTTKTSQFLDYTSSSLRHNTFSETTMTSTGVINSTTSSFLLSNDEIMTSSGMEVPHTDSKIIDESTYSTLTNTTNILDISSTDYSSLPSDVQTGRPSVSTSAPLLIVVFVLAFLTLLVLFILMIRYRCCKRASYYVNELYEMENYEKKPLKESSDQPVSSVIYGEKVTKEWLV